MGAERLQGEFDFRDKVLEILSKDFHIHKEKGTTGKYLFTDSKKPRIDAIIIPKDLTDWKNKNIVFGIEFKDPKKMVTTKQVTETIGQIEDYSYALFGDYGSIPILVCPPLQSFITNSYGRRTYDFQSRLLGKKLIGEIKSRRINGEKKLWFCINGVHPIWNQWNGVQDGKKMNLVRRIGNTHNKIEDVYKIHDNNKPKVVNNSPYLKRLKGEINK